MRRAISLITVATATFNAAHALAARRPTRALTQASIAVVAYSRFRDAQRVDRIRIH